MKNLREQANRVRNLPLQDVANHFGGIQDRHDMQRIDFASCSVWLGTGDDCQRFYDHHAGRGGGGAIDLAMHVLGCDFKEAVKALAGMLGDGVIPMPKPAPVQTPPAQVHVQFMPPAPQPQYQSRIAEYLTKERGLPLVVCTQAFNQGHIYADSRRNVVFLCNAPDGRVTGAELCGTGTTRYKGMAPGSRRGIGFFTLTNPAPTELVVVESALDALAYRTLFPDGSSTIISTAGVLPACSTLADLAVMMGLTDIVIAYDNDAAGDTASEQLMASMAAQMPTVRRRRPWMKDWNDIVIAAQQANSHPNAEPRGACQADLFVEVT